MIKYFLISLIIVLSDQLTAAGASDVLIYPVENKNVVYTDTLPDSMLNYYLSDDELMAMFDESVKADYWAMIWQWLWANFLRYIFTDALMPFWNILFYVIIIGIFLYFISRFFKVSLRGLFYGPKTHHKQSLGGVVYDDELKSDINEKLGLAIQDHNYREALRLLFVQTLQQLNTGKQIILSKGKTNLQYYRELDPQLKTGFRQLNLIFDYVWYGEFPLSEERFSTFRQFFTDYQKKLGV